MDVNRLSSHSIRELRGGERIPRILAAALDAVEPGIAIRRHVKQTGELMWVDERAYDLKKFRRVRLIGAGKAGYPMARTTAEIIGSNLSDGLVIVKDGYLDKETPVKRVKFYEARHPTPDERGVQATRRMIEMLADGQKDELVIMLISGGGSALLTAPAKGISLGDLQQLTNILLASGATIQEINCIRKHLDLVKGGGLARLAAPATMITLILSDVIGNPLDVIASGPTVPDPTTFQDALDVLNRYHLTETAPEAVLERLQSGAQGEIEETPKPGDLLFTAVYNVITGSNIQAAQAAQEAAGVAGFNTQVLTTSLQGEAKQAGRELAGILGQVAENGRPWARPACLIAGGETTVTLQSRAGEPTGLGGRNQELAIAAALALDGLTNVALVTLATDGGDGPTDAAGAAATGETIQRGKQMGLQAQNFLDRHDSYHFFARLDDLIKPGPTQTNVNDLTFLFAL